MNLDRALAQSKHSTPKCSGPTAWTRWVTCPLGFWIRYFRTDLRERVAINCLLRKKGSPKRQCGRNWRVKEELIFSFPNPHSTGFIDFPGGAKKFTIRHDPRGQCYWSLTNPV